MSDNQDIKALQKEVKALRKTVYSLKDTIVGLTNQIETGSSESPYEGGQYNVFPNRSNEDSGLTAAELAAKWGKSRSRTSEVLNKLVEDGQIVKYRDGRMIRFRSVDE